MQDGGSSAKTNESSSRENANLSHGYMSLSENIYWCLVGLLEGCWDSENSSGLDDSPIAFSTSQNRLPTIRSPMAIDS